MSAEYSNELRGSLFKNERKREGKKDAEYRGSCEIAGVAYWIDCWVQESKKGQKYLSLKFKRKEAALDKPVTVVRDIPDFDEQIPF